MVSKNGAYARNRDRIRGDRNRHVSSCVVSTDGGEGGYIAVHAVLLGRRALMRQGAGASHEAIEGDKNGVFIQRVLHAGVIERCSSVEGDLREIDKYSSKAPSTCETRETTGYAGLPDGYCKCRRVPMTSNYHSMPMGMVRYEIVLRWSGHDRKPKIYNEHIMFRDND